MKKNNWLSYFIYTVVLSCYIIFTYLILAFIDKQASTTFNPLPFMVWSMILFIVLGLLLGTEKLLFETRKEGNWRINLPKIIFLGIPLLYFSVGILLTYCPINFIAITLATPIMFFLTSRTNFIAIFQVILGYVIITSFTKVKD